MPALPQPPIGRHLCRHGLLALAMLSLLGGCGTPNYDFGEVRPSLVSDSIHDWLGPAAAALRPASTFELTDDERQLRDLAFPLIEPPYDSMTPSPDAAQVELTLNHLRAIEDNYRTALPPPYPPRLVTAY
jgi:hypothetical protein